MPTSAPPRFAPRPSTAVAILALVGVIVVGLVALIDAGAARPFDEAVIGSVRAAPLVAPLDWLRTATQAGSTWWTLSIAVLVGLVEVVRGRAWVGVTAAAAIGLGALANSTIKLVVARPRPDVLTPIVVEPGYSFPSGHSLSAMVAYGVIAVLVARSGLPRWARAVIIGLLAGLVAMVGLSRVYLGAHYPTDVIGGWLIGFAWVTLFAAASVGVDARVSAAPERADGVAGEDPTAPRSGPPVTG
ncbi:MAG: phosphatase PAP2 family protein [Chloroflexota bacterium]